jgi:hypothetical protein
MAHTLQRYSIPTAPEADGESVTLCDDCRDVWPDHLIEEWLESQASWNGCDGLPDGEDCPHLEDDEDDET